MSIENNENTNDYLKNIKISLYERGGLNYLPPLKKQQPKTLYDARCEIEAYKYIKEASNDQIVLLVSFHPILYGTINVEQAKNPKILYAALINYDPATNEINPISFAEREALTEENIDIAFEKGNIINICNNPKQCPLLSSPYYVIKCLENAESTSELYEIFNLISDELKNNSQIRKFFKNIPSSYIKSSTKNNDHVPDGNIQKYKYFQSAIGILPNGDHDEHEIKKGELLWQHSSGIIKIIEYFKSKYPNDVIIDKLLSILKALVGYSLHAQKCSEFGIIIIIIIGEEALVWFPETITLEQYSKLLEIAKTEMTNLVFHFMYKGEEFDEVPVQPGVPETRDLNYMDTEKIIEALGILDIDGRQKSNATISKK